MQSICLRPVCHRSPFVPSPFVIAVHLSSRPFCHQSASPSPFIRGPFVPSPVVSRAVVMDPYEPLNVARNVDLESFTTIIGVLRETREALFTPSKTPCIDDIGLKLSDKEHIAVRKLKKVEKRRRIKAAEKSQTNIVCSSTSRHDEAEEPEGDGQAGHGKKRIRVACCR